MGAFFTSIQVFTGNGAADQARPRLIEAIERFVVAQGFSAVGEGEESDRSIIVGPAGEAPWIAVFDDATEDQDMDKLEALAGDISKELATAAACVLVHDSDVLELRLMRQGDRVDSYSSYPEYFTRKKPGKKAREESVGHPEQWEGLFAPGKGAADLRARWDDKRLFAEATLAAVAEILGWDPELSAVGYNYLDKATPGIKKLGFRLAQRPAHESKATGPTAFMAGGYSPVVEACVGDPLRLHVSVQNTGRSSKGLRVAVWGAAIDAGLCAPERVALTLGRPEHGARVEAPLVEAKIEGGSMRLADLADIEIPPGLADLHAVAAAEPGQMRKAMEAWFDAQIHARIEGEIAHAGSGAIHVGFVPTENAQHGQFAHTMELKVSRPFRRPLRCPQEKESLVLRPLADQSKLFVFMPLSEDREASASFAAEAIERWAEMISPAGEGSYSTTLMPEDPGARPKIGTLKAKGFKDSKRWKEIRGGLAAMRFFAAALGKGHGFSLSYPLYPSEDRKDPALPHLGLWMTVTGKSEAEIAAARAQLREVADQALDRGLAAQAILGRWGWAPESFGDVTPYEYATGVDSSGGFTMQQSWCTRFLRGVTEDAMWLGPALLDRLGDTTAIGRVAEVTRIGQGIRIELRAPDGIDALEQALSPILSSGDDWKAAWSRRYGRG